MGRWHQICTHVEVSTSVLPRPVFNVSSGAADPNGQARLPPVGPWEIQTPWLSTNMFHSHRPAVCFVLKQSDLGRTMYTEAQLFSLPGKLPPNPKGYHNYLGELPSKACVY